jgi:hypothetical protein
MRKINVHNGVMEIRDADRQLAKLQPRPPYKQLFAPE